jgi:hypothetical protein
MTDLPAPIPATACPPAPCPPATLPGCALTPTRFRADFPAFLDQGRYPDAAVSLYLNLAFASMNPLAWLQYYDYGMELFAAHYLVLDQIDMKGAVRGAAGQPGPASSKSVGGASISFSADASESGAGHWNQTGYGRRFYRLTQLVGMGGAQLIGGCPQPGVWFPGSAAIYGPIGVDT